MRLEDEKEAAPFTSADLIDAAARAHEATSRRGKGLKSMYRDIVMFLNENLTAVETVMKHDPITSWIVWGNVRTLLQVCRRFSFGNMHAQ